MSISALLIPTDDALPIRRIIVGKDGLADLQAAVGGSIEAVPYYAHEGITTYINESGKFECEPNRRATQLLGPGLFAGDYIAGNLVVCGFDPDTGEDLDCPEWFETWLDRPVRSRIPRATNSMSVVLVGNGHSPRTPTGTLASLSYWLHSRLPASMSLVRLTDISSQRYSAIRLTRAVPRLLPIRATSIEKYASVAKKCPASHRFD
jgi:hypothetical protein